MRFVQCRAFGLAGVREMFWLQRDQSTGTTFDIDEIGVHSKMITLHGNVKNIHADTAP